MPSSPSAAAEAVVTHDGSVTRRTAEAAADPPIPSPFVSPSAAVGVAAAAACQPEQSTRGNNTNVKSLPNPHSPQAVAPNPNPPSMRGGEAFAMSTTIVSASSASTPLMPSPIPITDNVQHRAGEGRLGINSCGGDPTPLQPMMMGGAVAGFGGGLGTISIGIGIAAAASSTAQPALYHAHHGSPPNNSRSTHHLLLPPLASSTAAASARSPNPANGASTGGDGVPPNNGEISCGLEPSAAAAATSASSAMHTASSSGASPTLRPNTHAHACDDEQHHGGGIVDSPHCLNKKALNGGPFEREGSTAIDGCCGRRSWGGGGDTQGRSPSKKERDEDAGASSSQAPPIATKVGHNVAGLATDDSAASPQCSPSLLGAPPSSTPVVASPLGISTEGYSVGFSVGRLSRDFAEKYVSIPPAGAVAVANAEAGALPSHSAVAHTIASPPEVPVATDNEQPLAAACDDAVATGGEFSAEYRSDAAGASGKSSASLLDAKADEDDDESSPRIKNATLCTPQGPGTGNDAADSAARRATSAHCIATASTTTAAVSRSGSQRQLLLLGPAAAMLKAAPTTCTSNGAVPIPQPEEEEDAPHTTEAAAAIAARAASTAFADDVRVEEEEASSPSPLLASSSRHNPHAGAPFSRLNTASSASVSLSSSHRPNTRIGSQFCPQMAPTSDPSSGVGGGMSGLYDSSGRRSMRPTTAAAALIEQLQQAGKSSKAGTPRRRGPMYASPSSGTLVGGGASTHRHRSPCLSAGGGGGGGGQTTPRSARSSRSASLLAASTNGSPAKARASPSNSSRLHPTPSAGAFSSAVTAEALGALNSAYRAANNDEGCDAVVVGQRPDLLVEPHTFLPSDSASINATRTANASTEEGFSQDAATPATAIAGNAATTVIEEGGHIPPPPQPLSNIASARSPSRATSIASTHSVASSVGAMIAAANAARLAAAASRGRSASGIGPTTPRRGAPNRADQDVGLDSSDNVGAYSNALGGAHFSAVANGSFARNQRSASVASTSSAASSAASHTRRRMGTPPFLHHSGHEGGGGGGVIVGGGGGGRIRGRLSPNNAIAATACHTSAASQQQQRLAASSSLHQLYYPPPQQSQQSERSEAADQQQQLATVVGASHNAALVVRDGGDTARHQSHPHGQQGRRYEPLQQPRWCSRPPTPPIWSRGHTPRGSRRGSPTRSRPAEEEEEVAGADEDLRTDTDYALLATAAVAGDGATELGGSQKGRGGRSRSGGSPLLAVSFLNDSALVDRRADCPDGAGFATAFSAKEEDAASPPACGDASAPQTAAVIGDAPHTVPRSSQQQLGAVQLLAAPVASDAAAACCKGSDDGGGGSASAADLPSMASPSSLSRQAEVAHHKEDERQGEDYGDEGGEEEEGFVVGSPQSERESCPTTNGRSNEEEDASDRATATSAETPFEVVVCVNNNNNTTNTQPTVEVEVDAVELSDVQQPSPAPPPTCSSSPPSPQRRAVDADADADAIVCACVPSPLSIEREEEHVVAEAAASSSSSHAMDGTEQLSTDETACLANRGECEEAEKRLAVGQRAAGGGDCGFVDGPTEQQLVGSSGENDSPSTVHVEGIETLSSPPPPSPYRPIAFASLPPTPVNKTHKYPPTIDEMTQKAEGGHPTEMIVENGNEEHLDSPTETSTASSAVSHSSSPMNQQASVAMPSTPKVKAKTKPSPVVAEEGNRRGSAVSAAPPPQANRRSLSAAVTNTSRRPNPSSVRIEEAKPQQVKMGEGQATKKKARTQRTPSASSSRKPLSSASTAISALPAKKDVLEKKERSAAGGIGADGAQPFASPSPRSRSGPASAPTAAVSKRRAGTPPASSPRKAAGGSAAIAFASPAAARRTTTRANSTAPRRHGTASISAAAAAKGTGRGIVSAAIPSNSSPRAAGQHTQQKQRRSVTPSASSHCDGKGKPTATVAGKADARAKASSASPTVAKSPKKSAKKKKKATKGVYEGVAALPPASGDCFVDCAYTDAPFEQSASSAIIGAGESDAADENAVPQPVEPSPPPMPATNDDSPLEFVRSFEVSDDERMLRIVGTEVQHRPAVEETPPASGPAPAGGGEAHLQLSSNSALLSPQQAVAAVASTPSCTSTSAVALIAAESLSFKEEEQKEKASDESHLHSAPLSAPVTMASTSCADVGASVEQHQQQQQQIALGSQLYPQGSLVGDSRSSCGGSSRSISITLMRSSDSGAPFKSGSGSAIVGVSAGSACVASGSAPFAAPQQQLLEPFFAFASYPTAEAAAAAANSGSHSHSSQRQAAASEGSGSALWCSHPPGTALPPQPHNAAEDDYGEENSALDFSEEAAEFHGPASGDYLCAEAGTAAHNTNTVSNDASLQRHKRRVRAVASSSSAPRQQQQKQRASSAARPPLAHRQQRLMQQQQQRQRAASVGVSSTLSVGRSGARRASSIPSSRLRNSSANEGGACTEEEDEALSHQQQPPPQRRMVPSTVVSGGPAAPRASSPPSSRRAGHRDEDDNGRQHQHRTAMISSAPPSHQCAAPLHALHHFYITCVSQRRQQSPKTLSRHATPAPATRQSRANSVMSGNGNGSSSQRRQRPITAPPSDAHAPYGRSARPSSSSKVPPPPFFATPSTTIVAASSASPSTVGVYAGGSRSPSPLSCSPHQHYIHSVRSLSPSPATASSRRGSLPVPATAAAAAAAAGVSEDDRSPSSPTPQPLAAPPRKPSPRSGPLPPPVTSPRSPSPLPHNHRRRHSSPSPTVVSDDKQPAETEASDSSNRRRTPTRAVAQHLRDDASITTRRRSSIRAAARRGEDGEGGEKWEGATAPRNSKRCASSTISSSSRRADDSVSPQKQKPPTTAAAFAAYTAATGLVSPRRSSCGARGAGAVIGGGGLPQTVSNNDQCGEAQGRGSTHPLHSPQRRQRREGFQQWVGAAPLLNEHLHRYQEGGRAGDMGEEEVEGNGECERDNIGGVAGRRTRSQSVQTLSYPIGGGRSDNGSAHTTPRRTAAAGATTRSRSGTPRPTVSSTLREVISRTPTPVRQSFPLMVAMGTARRYVESMCSGRGGGGIGIGGEQQHSVAVDAEAPSVCDHQNERRSVAECSNAKSIGGGGNTTTIVHERHANRSRNATPARSSRSRDSSHSASSPLSPASRRRMSHYASRRPLLPPQTAAANDGGGDEEGPWAAFPSPSDASSPPLLLSPSPPSPPSHLVATVLPASSRFNKNTNNGANDPLHEYDDEGKEGEWSEDTQRTRSAHDKSEKGAVEGSPRSSRNSEKAPSLLCHLGVTPHYCTVPGGTVAVVTVDTTAVCKSSSGSSSSSPAGAHAQQHQHVAGCDPHLGEEEEEASCLPPPHVEAYASAATTMGASDAAAGGAALLAPSISSSLASPPSRFLRAMGMCSAGHLLASPLQEVGHDGAAMVSGANEDTCTAAATAMTRATNAGGSASAGALGDALWELSLPPPPQSPKGVVAAGASGPPAAGRDGTESAPILPSFTSARLETPAEGGGGVSVTAATTPTAAPPSALEELESEDSAGDGAEAGGAEEEEEGAAVAPSVITSAHYRSASAEAGAESTGGIYSIPPTAPSAAAIAVGTPTASEELGSIACGCGESSSPQSNASTPQQRLNSPPPNSNTMINNTARGATNNEEVGTAASQVVTQQRGAALLLLQPQHSDGAPTTAPQQQQQDEVEVNEEASKRPRSPQGALRSHLRRAVRVALVLKQQAAAAEAAEEALLRHAGADDGEGFGPPVVEAQFVHPSEAMDAIGAIAPPQPEGAPLTAIAGAEADAADSDAFVALTRENESLLARLVSLLS